MFHLPEVTPDLLRAYPRFETFVSQWAGGAPHERITTDASTSRDDNGRSA